MFSTSILCWLIGIGRQEIDLNQFLQYLAKAPFPNWFLARYFFYDGDPYSGTHSLNYLFSVPNNRTFGQVPLLPKNVSFLFISYFYPFNAWWQQKRNIYLTKPYLNKVCWSMCDLIVTTRQKRVNISGKDLEWIGCFQVPHELLNLKNRKGD